MLTVCARLTLNAQANPGDTVCVPLGQAVDVLRDLTIADSMKVENILLSGQVIDLKSIITNKDEQFKDCQDSRNRLNLVIANYQAQQTADKANAGTLEKLYKREVRAGRFKLVLIGGLAVLTAYSFLK